MAPNRDRTQSIESRPAPRRSESSVSQTQPAIKVVGFRVEGAAPSPSPPSTLLADSQRIEGNVISGSPNPVIIPPSFQVGLWKREATSGHLGTHFDSHASCLPMWRNTEPQCLPCLPGCRPTRQYSKQHTEEAGMRSYQRMRPLYGKELFLC